jgi:hypothetical protein
LHANQQQACQKAAWNRGHKYQCKILKKLGDREIPKAVLACMDLLTMKKHDIIPEQAWNMLLSLPSHIEDFKANGNYSNIELMAMGASQFSLTQGLCGGHVRQGRSTASSGPIHYTNEHRYLQTP